MRTYDDWMRMVAPAVIRRRVQRGLRWRQNPKSTPKTPQFLIAHGFLPDQIAPLPLLIYIWREARAPSPLNYVRNQR